MEHFFNALGDLVQAITWAFATLFGLYLFDMFMNPTIIITEEDEDKKDD
jgi:hypothetical protein